MVSFEHIPSTIRQPLYWVEIDGSRAGFPRFEERVLLVGTQIAAATVLPNIPIPIGSQAQADNAFGRGSQLAMMFKAFFANNWGQEVWALPMAESAGVVASGTITIAGSPTAAGTLNFYIAGIKVAINVTTTDTPTTLATALGTAITANPDLPVTAAPAAGVVTCSCKWKGVSGNDIDIRDSYYGPAGGEYIPAGLTVTYSGTNKLASGTLEPTFTTAITNMGEQPFEYIALPWTDTTSLAAWEAEMGLGGSGFADASRWGYIRQLYGHMFSAKRDTYANLLTFGITRNCATLSVMAVEVTSPSPIWEWTAAYTAKAGRALVNDPARPLQTLSLDGIKSAFGNGRFAITELNSLAGNGMATQRTLVGNSPMITRETTTYIKNRYAQLDDAYELVTTLATLARVLRNQRHAITSKYPRHKLADDGTRFGAGNAVVTPKIIKAELVAQYRIDEFNGLVENAAAFKANLLVERDANNPNRVNVIYPPDLINQLRIFAVLAQFRLQYDRGVDTVVAA